MQLANASLNRPGHPGAFGPIVIEGHAAEVVQSTFVGVPLMLSEITDHALYPIVVLSDGKGFFVQSGT